MGFYCLSSLCQLAVVIVFLLFLLLDSFAVVVISSGERIRAPTNWLNRREDVSADSSSRELGTRSGRVCWWLCETVATGVSSEVTEPSPAQRRNPADPGKRPTEPATQPKLVQDKGDFNNLCANFRSIPRLSRKSSCLGTSCRGFVYWWVDPVIRPLARPPTTPLSPPPSLSPAPRC